MYFPAHWTNFQNKRVIVTATYVGAIEKYFGICRIERAYASDKGFNVMNIYNSSPLYPLPLPDSKRDLFLKISYWGPKPMVLMYYVAFMAPPSDRVWNFELQAVDVEEDTALYQVGQTVDLDEEVDKIHKTVLNTSAPR